MDDFETFKSSREKMDPTSRKMSDQQWKQAYAAYRSARERVSGSESKSKKRRSSKKVAPARGAHTPSSLSELSRLRRTVRDQSAYTDLRLVVDVLVWLAIAVVVLAAIITLFYYTSAPAAIISLLGAAVQVIGIVLVRLLVQVLIDLPDIALYQSLQGSVPGRAPSPDTQP